jgi:hypothetical protein
MHIRLCIQAMEGVGLTAGSTGLYLLSELLQ